MALSSTENRKLYLGDGATTQFAFPFAYQDQAHLKVKSRTGTGSGTAEVDLTLSTNYTVSPSASALNGGTVTLLSPPDNSTTLVIFRDPPQTQTLDLVEGDSLPAESVESAFDKIVMMVQRIQEQLTRAAILSETDSSLAMTLPYLGDRTSTLLGFDASGAFTPLLPVALSLSAVSPFMATFLADLSVAAALTTLGVSAFAQTLLDDPDAVTARATLGVVPTDGPVVISNGKIVPSVSGNALTLTLKTQAGASPSVSTPVIAAFRDSTLANSGYQMVTCTTQPTLVIDASSTLGHAGSFPEQIHAFLMDVSGTIELVALGGANIIGAENFVTTTAIGTTGVGDSRYVPYSTIARSGFPVRYLQGFESSQTTAGLWAALPTRALGDPENQKRALRSTVISSGNAGHGTGSTAIRNFSVSTALGEDWTVTSDTTLATVYQCLREGLYDLSAIDKHSTASQLGFSIDATGTQLTSTIFSLFGTAPFLRAIELPVGLNSEVQMILRVLPGQRIRVHDAGVNSGNECSMRITRIGN